MALTPPPYRATIYRYCFLYVAYIHGRACKKYRYQVRTCRQASGSGYIAGRRAVHILIVSFFLIAHLFLVWGVRFAPVKWLLLISLLFLVGDVRFDPLRRTFLIKVCFLSRAYDLLQ